LNIVFYNVVTKGRRGPRFQWCYFGEKKVPFNRVTRPEEFDPEIIEPGCGGLTVEVSAPPGRPVWDNPEAEVDGVLRGLVDVGLIADKSDVKSVDIERVVECYPVYVTDYGKQLRALKDSLKRFPNLTPAGRTGLFWYNNMDHSIALAMKLARRVERAGAEGGDPEESETD
jgi:protoporphyrinogen oxidase